MQSIMFWLYVFLAIIIVLVLSIVIIHYLLLRYKKASFDRHSFLVSLIKYPIKPKNKSKQSFEQLFSLGDSIKMETIVVDKSKQVISADYVIPESMCCNGLTGSYLGLGEL